MKIKLILLTGTMLMALFFTSCWDEPTSTDLVTEQLVSISSYDTSKDFTKYKNFSIPDYIVQVTSNGTEWNKITSSDAQNVLSRITTDLNKAGYTKVDSTDPNLDLTVNVGWADITNVIIGYPTWWFDYWDYWDYDWYYPYYPYYSAAVLGSYSVGLLMIQIAENKPDSTGKYPVIWTGYVRMIEYITVHSNAEVNNAIDDCFKTPPFSIK